MPWRKSLVWTVDTPVSGPVHICSRYTTPAKCSRNMFSVHERSYYEHCEMFSVPIRSGWKWHASRSAQYDVLCIHCATCEVILMCTLRADSGLRAKPRPLRTLFSVHDRSYLFWMCTKGGDLFREHGLTMFQREQLSLEHRSDYKKWCVPRTCSENMFPLELYQEQVWTPGRKSNFFPLTYRSTCGLGETPIKPQADIHQLFVDLDWQDWAKRERFT